MQVGRPASAQDDGAGSDFALGRRTQLDRQLDAMLARGRALDDGDPFVLEWSRGR